MHRVTFRKGLKDETVTVGHRLFGYGSGVLAPTLTDAVLLVLDVAVGRAFAIPDAAVVGVLLVTLWFLVPMPLVRRAGRTSLVRS